MAIEHLKKRKWPEDAYEVTKVFRGDPLEQREGNIIFWLGSDPNRNKGLITMARKKFYQVDDVTKNGIVKDKYQILEILSRVRSTSANASETLKSLGWLVNSETCNVSEVLFEIREEIQKSSIKKVAVVSVFNHEQLRKDMEIAFLDLDVEVKIYTPQGSVRKQATTHNNSNTETIQIHAKDMSYADMARSMKEHIDPNNITIIEMRKTRDNEIIIVTEIGDAAQKIRKQIEDNTDGIETKIISRNRPVIISQIDILTNIEEVQEAVANLGKLNKEEVQVKFLTQNRRGLQTAEVWLPAEQALDIANTGRIKIGWSSCPVRNKVKIVRCLKCLKIGHREDKCWSKITTKLCFKCTKEGHLAKECENGIFRNVCKVNGHKPDTMACPKLRSIIHSNYG